MLKVFLGVEAVLGGVVAVAFLASTVADNWVPVLAVIGAVTTSAVTPVVMSNLNNRAAERRAAQAAAIAQAAEDRNWKRQDEVAKQVRDAAKLAELVAEKAATVAEKVSEVADTTAASNAEVAKKVSEVADTTASSAAATEVKLDEVAAHVAARATSTETKLEELATGQEVIRTLVNGNLTVSMNGHLAAMRNERVALITLADLQEASNKPIFVETRLQVEDVSKSMLILEGEIRSRLATEQENLEKTSDA